MRIECDVCGTQSTMPGMSLAVKFVAYSISRLSEGPDAGD